jgi:16S rRNA (adenine1518-N6/adenine1519-N6)-dimethyltransferase
VRLQPRVPSTLAKDEQLLSALVNTAFQQRRKTLRNTLKTIASEAQILAANIKPDARAETLSVSDFVHLANILHGDIECPASASK